MKHITVRSFAFLLVALSFSFADAATTAKAWEPVGPNGGDARSFAADPANPKHIYLGTLDSWLYQTDDGGSTWKRLAKLGKSDNLVLDNIVVDSSDPKTLLIGVWILSRPDGGLFISHDSGVTWDRVADMDGQSIRALAQAPSNPRVFVAGTLKGVYRSEDGGAHWTQMSPTGSQEIHEVESVAIDPTDPKTIYAGTWHLPWKTTDGGANWRSIKQGLIDDSDVFSIIIDPKQPATVYASACSGIYKSETGGEVFRKQQGIPNTARRTRVLMQDPNNRNIVFAGTTEGLYQTANGGTSWQRLTGPDVIVNDVYVDPANDKHVLLATDRSGVLQSVDGGVTFSAANNGFSQRQVEALLTDSKNPRIIYAGVLNDKSYGGVFVSEDGGASWTQRSAGLEGRDVFALEQAPNGTIYAGTSHGILSWDGSQWEMRGNLLSTKEESKYVIQKKKKVKVTKTVTVPAGMIESRVRGLDLSGPIWYAATSSGLYTSDNQGTSWQGGPAVGRSEFLHVSATADGAYAVGRQFAVSSSDGGKTWQASALPEKLNSVRVMAAASDGSLWLGGREGVFYSEDKGQSWQQLTKLPFNDVDGLDYDPEYKRFIATSAGSTLVMTFDRDQKNWKWWDIGWNVHTVRSVGGRLIAASLYDGVVMEPKPSGGSVEAATR